MNWLIQFATIVTELANLLNMKFLPERREQKSPIGQSLRRVLELGNRADLLPAEISLFREAEMAELGLLIKQLKVVRDHDERLLARFRKDLHGRVTLDQYYGIRQEINTTSSLIQKDLKFVRQESPDFVVRWDGGDVYVECGSLHWNRRPVDDIRPKLQSTIRRKSAKPYANMNTALFLDFTHALHQNNAAANPLRADAIRRTLQQSVDKSSFGSVVTFGYSYDQALGRFESVYIRYDNSEIAPELRQFLDAHYHSRHPRRVKGNLTPPHG